MCADFSEDDQCDLERLLDGRADDVHSPRLRRLTGLLGAAAASARPHELRGESEALAAFRAARAEPRRARIGLPTVKVAAAVAALVLSTAAAAMATGMVPAPLLDAAARTPIHATPRVPRTGGDGRDRPPAPSDSPDRTAGGVPRTSVSPGRTGSSEPSASASEAGSDAVPVVDLCVAYMAVVEPRRARALADIRLARLISLAGDVGSVDAYCGQLLASSSPTSSPPSASFSPSPSPSPSVTEPSPSPSPSSPSPSVTSSRSDPDWPRWAPRPSRSA